jgi:hypothetical protein
VIFVEKFEDTKRFSETVSRKGQTTNEKDKMTIATTYKAVFRKLMIEEHKPH